MRRYLFALVALLLVTASPAFAGYIIIRVLLEGAAGGPGTGGPSSPDSMGPLAGGFGSGKPGRPGGSSQGPPAGVLPTPMMGGPTTPGAQPKPVVTGSMMDHTRSVVILVPLDTDFLRGKLDPARPANEQTNPEFRKLIAPYYGRQLKASLFIDSSTIQLYEELLGQPAPRKTLATQMRERYATWARGKNDPQALYDALILALEAGIVREHTANKDGTTPKDAMAIAQELLDVAAEKKLTLPAAAQQFVTAWGQMSGAVKMQAAQMPAAEEWKVKLDAKDVRTEGHYSVIYWDTLETEVARRTAQLNDNFAAFFLVQATRGVVAPVPGKPLLVVLAQQGSSFNVLRPALDGLPSPTNAFYSPEHDLLVLSPELMDSVGLTFQKQNQQYFTKGFIRDRLLDGQIPKIDAAGSTGARPDDVARASTLAFVEKFVVENSDIAAVSREGTRQLLFATGGLPKHVTLPNWLTQGALNTYNRPHGPAYVTKGEDDKAYMSVTFSTGYGVPNYVNQRYLRDLDEHKELNADRVKLLEHILTDAYFTGLKDAIDPDPAPPAKKKAVPAGTVAVGPTAGPMGIAIGGLPGPMGIGIPAPGGGAGKPGGAGGSSLGPPPGFGSGFNPMGAGQFGAGNTVVDEEEDPLVLQRKKRERLNIKSQATAWALYYYLDRAKPAQLKQYIAELNKLPRDLPIDGRTAYSAFVRVFKLSTTDDGVADPALMKQFAKEWWDYIKIVPSVYHDIPLVMPAPVTAPAGGGVAPMFPGGGRPGGGPDAGGGPGK